MKRRRRPARSDAWTRSSQAIRCRACSESRSWVQGRSSSHAICVRDLFSFPELREIELSLHDIDEERLATAEQIARLGAAKHGAHPIISASVDRRAALEGADAVVNMIAVGGHAATVTDFEVPEPVRAAPDHRRHARRRRDLPRPAHLPGARRHRHRHARGLPRRLAAQLHQPDGDEHPVPARTAPRAQGRGLCHSVYWTVHDLCELVDVPFDEVDFLSAGVNHQAWVLRWERDGAEPVPAARRADRGRPGAAPPGARRHVPPAGLLPDRDQRALQRVRALVPASTTAEVERLRIPVGDYVRHHRRRNVARDTRPCGSSWRAGEYVEQRRRRGRVRAAGHPQPRHGDAADDPGDDRQRRPDRQPPARRRRRGARARSTGSASIRSASARCRRSCAALNRQFLNVVELTVRAAVEGDPRLVRHAAMLDPQHGRDADRRPDLGALATTWSQRTGPRCRRRSGCRCHLTLVVGGQTIVTRTSASARRRHSSRSRRRRR